MQYRPEIDGLRAVAVLPVILFHAGFSTFDGGFVGVDIFFVISGFLITSIILREQAEDRFSIINFYERRARRIMPALIAVTLVCIPVAWVLLFPSDMRDFARSVMATGVFSSNIYFWLRADYFDTASELKPLLHTWSLAIEEQYYLFFPIVLIVLNRYRKALIGPALVLIGVVSLIWSQYLTVSAPSSAFYLIQSRAWELMAGSLAALYVSRANSGSDKPVLGLVGLALIVASVFLYGSETPFPGVFAIPPVVGTVLVLLFATENTPVARLLASRPLVGIGLISYSAYLWHQPVFAFSRHAMDTAHLSVLLLVGLSIISLGLGYLSWRFVETPFRNRQRISRPLVWSATGLGCAMLIAFGAAGHLTRGFTDRYDAPTAVALSEFEMPRIQSGWCFYSVNSNASLEIGAPGQQCYLGAQEGAVQSALLIGDSFAAQYEPFWDALGKSTDMRIHSVTTNWCHPALTENFAGPASDRAFRQCLANRELLRADLSSYDVIILGGHWGNLLEQGLLADMTDLLGVLAQKEDMDVVIMASPEQYVRRTVESTFFAKRTRPVVDVDLDQPAQEANAILADAALGFPSATFIGRDALFEDSITSDGLPYSFDGQHISVYGSQKAAEHYIETILAD